MFFIFFPRKPQQTLMCLMCARHNGRHTRSEAVKRTNTMEQKKAGTLQKTPQLSQQYSFLGKKYKHATHAQHLIAKVKEHQLWRELQMKKKKR